MGVIKMRYIEDRKIMDHFNPVTGDLDKVLDLQVDKAFRRPKIYRSLIKGKSYLKNRKYSDTLYLIDSALLTASFSFFIRKSNLFKEVFRNDL